MMRPNPLPRPPGSHWTIQFLLGLVMVMITPHSFAGPSLDALLEQRANQQSTSPSKNKLLEGIIEQHNLAYGSDPCERLDTYRPADDQELAPIIFMVHGGAWKLGDKQASTVVTNKVKRWVPQGFILVSVNYPMLPDANPREQAVSVARALAYVQRHAPEYRGDPTRVILMGHSAGAHLVCLLSSHPDLATKQGVKPWLGTVALDSAAYDVVAIMQHRHFKLYDDAFGQDPVFWKSVSPFHVLAQPIPPLLAVCSTRRQVSTTQATLFAAHAQEFNSRVTVLPENLSHREINRQLGEPGTYTDAVEHFLRTLDPMVAAKLSPR